MDLESYYRNFRPLFLKKKEIPGRSFIMAQEVLRLTRHFERRIRIVDIGCGTGQFGMAMHEQCEIMKIRRSSFLLEGLEIGDLSTDGLYDASHEASLEKKWPFGDTSVDVVYIGAVLEHVFDYHFQLNEANRVLGKGGLFLVDVPNLGCIRDTLQLLTRKHPSWLRDMQHIHGYTLSFLKTLLGQHGFLVERTQCDRIPGLSLTPPTWIRKLLASWGSCICLSSRKAFTTEVVDGRLRHLYDSWTELSTKTVRVQLEK